jgi:hypothetical protein
MKPVVLRPRRREAAGRHDGGGGTIKQRTLLCWASS